MFETRARNIHEPEYRVISRRFISMTYTWSTVTLLWKRRTSLQIFRYRSNFRYLFANLEWSLHERFHIWFISIPQNYNRKSRASQIDFDPRFERTEEKLLKLIDARNTSSQILSRIYFTLYPYLSSFHPTFSHTLHLIRICINPKSNISNSVRTWTSSAK